MTPPPPYLKQRLEAIINEIAHQGLDGLYDDEDVERWAKSILALVQEETARVVEEIEKANIETGSRTIRGYVMSYRSQEVQDKINEIKAELSERKQHENNTEYS